VLKRDQLIALITAELDAERHGRGGVLLDAWPDADHTTRLVFITRNIEEAAVKRLFDAVSALNPQT